MDKKRKTAKYILYFGRLGEEKGTALLIKAFLKATSKEARDWKLRIAGDGPEKENLEKMASGAESIEFLGRLDGNSLRKEISSARFVAVPSLWPENFPYSVLESFALRKPVLAANIGGLTEMIDNGKTGLFFEPGDENNLAEKILWAVNHSDKIKLMGENAQKEVLKKYNSEGHYEKLIKIYERIKNN